MEKQQPASALRDALEAKGLKVTMGMYASGTIMMYVHGVAIEVWNDGSLIKVDGRATAFKDVASALLAPSRLGN